MKIESPEISIIIRTKNEERWIGHCLKMIYDQNFDNFEVILVDNNSSDHTLEVAKRFPLAAIINIDKFIPGKALNIGIKASSGRYIVCISAHCVPNNINWLGDLYNNFDGINKIAGVYGRQLPVSYTSDSDKRDLLITFGRDRKIQVKDYFFHNANSMIPRAIWEKFPFDETLTNIEDRVWGKEVIDAGYEIIYDPVPSVYHHHGLHQHDSSSKRAKGIATILEKTDNEYLDGLPSSLMPENANFAAIIPVLGKQKKIKNIDFLQRQLDYLKNEKFINNIYILTDNIDVTSLAKDNNIKILNRSEEIKDRNISLEKVLQYSLKSIELLNDFPEGLVYINYLYPFRPKSLVDNLIQELQHKGLDTTFSSYIDYGNFWKKNEEDAYFQVSDALVYEEKRNPIHKALYGVGCVSLSNVIRSGRLVGNKIGILPFENLLFALRIDKETPEEVILAGIKYTDNNNV
jgi:rhamnosyltransferase